MFNTIAQALDWFGICVFALSGALVASRKQMDIVGFAMLGTVTGIGGGTVRDILLGNLPVFWVQKPSYLIACVVVSCVAFFAAHQFYSRMQILIWCDAIGLALFSVTGAQVSLDTNTSGIVAIAMGVATATFGGLIRDLLGAEIPMILHREIYLTAALLGSSILVIAEMLNVPREAALVIGFAAALALRAAAIKYEFSLPTFPGASENDKH